MGVGRPLFLRLPVGFGVPPAHEQHAEIYKFVINVFPKPEVIGRAHAYRGESFEYEQLTLVGHSEGGLLLRRVIVRAAELDAAIDTFMEESLHKQATKPAPDGILKAKMRLFAPALGGDMQSGILGVLTSLPVISHALSASAAKKGMDQGSPSVTEARKRSDNYAKYLRFECFEAHISGRRRIQSSTAKNTTATRNA